MIPNEARVGNLVLILTEDSPNPHGYPGFIKAITKQSEFDFTLPEQKELVIIPAKHCVGIKVTHEWFDLNNFEYNADLGTYKIEDLTLEPIPDSEAFHCFWNPEVKIGPVIQYIHQFQNFYFVINGEEFNVKVSPHIP